jgi:hypothetical protein
MRLPVRTAAVSSLAALMIAGLSVAAVQESTAAVPAAVSASSFDSAASAPGALKPRGSGNPFVDVRVAAGHMPMTATALAGGVAKAAKIKGGVNSNASELRSGLTYLLTEHVYLAGVAVATAYHAGADSAEFKLAAATLDDNSKAVAAAVGSVAPAEEKAFLARWRGHIGDFVTYAVGAKTPGAKGKKLKNVAVKNLTAYAKNEGKFFDRISGGALPAAAVEKDLMHHIMTLASAVDALAAGKANAFNKLKVAADHMAGSAAILAGGIDKATKMGGNPASPAADLRAGLTHLLTSHVYLAGIAVFVGYTEGLDSAAFAGAAGALDKNSVEIAKAVGSVAGAANEKVFLAAWRGHIGDFVTYAKGEALGDAKLRKIALKNLDAYRFDQGKFFAKVTGGVIPADVVAKDLKVHIETLAGAINSLKAALVKS